MNPNRQPKGIPTGGQFAPGSRSESEVDLDESAYFEGQATAWTREVRRASYRLSTVELARLVATRAHEGVYRRTGDAYIEHPKWVANHLQDNGADPEVVAAGWLHDTVEDTEVTPEYLRTLFPERTVSAVVAVTKIDGEDHSVSIHRAASHPDGNDVKIADNLHNSSPEQLEVFPYHDRLRRDLKYRGDRAVLYAYKYSGDLGIDFNKATGTPSRLQRA